MAWMRLDDKFHSHPKVVSVGLDAVGLHILALTYCAEHLTDGHIPAAWVREKAQAKTRKLTAALTEHGLWERNGTGWVIHDYLDFNPTKEAIMEKRRRDSARKVARK